MYMYIHFSLLQEGRSCLFKRLVHFGRHHYPKDTRQAVCEWLELDESVANANAQENNFVINLI